MARIGIGLVMACLMIQDRFCFLIAFVRPQCRRKGGVPGGARARGFSSSASGVEPPFTVPVLYLYRWFLAFLEDSELRNLCKLLILLGLI